VAPVSQTMGSGCAVSSKVGSARWATLRSRKLAVAIPGPHVCFVRSQQVPGMPVAVWQLRWMGYLRR
jgi:hypothetical protein